MTEIIVEFPSPLTEKEKKMIYGYKGELIRCKDCKHFDMYGFPHCDRIFSIAVDPLGFCFWGEQGEWEGERMVEKHSNDKISAYIAEFCPAFIRHLDEITSIEDEDEQDDCSLEFCKQDFVRLLKIFGAEELGTGDSLVAMDKAYRWMSGFIEGHRCWNCRHAVVEREAFEYEGCLFYCDRCPPMYEGVTLCENYEPKGD